MTAHAARPSVAMVIGSGSVKCAAALGIQEVLQRNGVAVDLYVGCSAGSIYAALMALGHSVEESAEAVAGLWTREVTSVSRRSAMFRAIQPRLFGFSTDWGLRDDRPVLKALSDGFGDTTFAETKIPLLITATDFDSGEQVVLEEGGLVDAIRASISIPFVFPPWRHQGRLLVDGYASDPLPVGAAIREGAGTILAVGFESPYQERITSAARFAFQLSSVMTNNLLRSRLAFHNLAHHGEVVPIVPEFRERIGLFDTDKIPGIIEDGRRAAEEQLPYILASVEAAGG